MNKPYKITAQNVKKSPFSSVASVQTAIREYQKGNAIGFTYQASLKSMGLIPRANGMYELGKKYQH